MLEDLDKSHLRGMMKDTFICSARCCDDAADQKELQQWCALLFIAVALSAKGMLVPSVACVHMPLRDGLNAVRRLPRKQASVLARCRFRQLCHLVHRQCQCTTWPQQQKLASPQQHCQLLQYAAVSDASKSSRGNGSSQVE